MTLARADPLAVFAERKPLLIGRGDDVFELVKGWHRIQGRNKLGESYQAELDIKFEQ